MPLTRHAISRPAKAIFDSLPEDARAPRFREVLERWCAASSNGALPTRQDLKLVTLIAILGELTLTDCQDPENPVFWFVSPETQERTGANANIALLDCFPAALHSLVRQRIFAVLSQPCGFYSHCVDTLGLGLKSWGLPLADLDGRLRYYINLNLPSNPDAPDLYKGFYDRLVRYDVTPIDIGAGMPQEGALGDFHRSA